MKISGIYSITNTVSGKKYYGSSVNVWQRQRQHWYALRRGKHHNPHLQSAWDQYGELAFVFALVENVNPESLVLIEQQYLDGNHDGYNISKCAEVTTRGLKWSLEARKRMSATRKGCKLSDDHKKALSVAATGRRMTDEQRLNVSARMKGCPVSDAAKEKISVTISGLWGNQEYREMIVSAQNAGKATDIARSNYSAAIAARWSDPEQRKKMSVERKARWADPKYREKMIEKRRIQGQKLRERNALKKEKENALS